MMYHIPYGLVFIMFQGSVFCLNLYIGDIEGIVTIRNNLS